MNLEILDSLGTLKKIKGSEEALIMLAQLAKRNPDKYKLLLKHIISVCNGYS
jgi:hypothetical protein